MSSCTLSRQKLQKPCVAKALPFPCRSPSPSAQVWRRDTRETRTPTSIFIMGSHSYLALDIVRSTATLHAYLPSREAKLAILIIPGGSYRPGPFGWCKTAEGSDIARWLADNLGIAGFVLHYRMPNGHPKLPLFDAEVAIDMVRNHTGRTSRVVGVMGFSAGGHLAALAITRFRPDFGLLMYPVISMDFANFTHANTRREFLGRTPTPTNVAFYSADRHVSPSTPPALLIHALDDNVVSINSSRLYHRACLAHAACSSTLVELRMGGHPWVNKPFAWDTAKTAIILWLCAQGHTGAGSARSARAILPMIEVCATRRPVPLSEGQPKGRWQELRDELLALPGVASVSQTLRARRWYTTS